MNKYYVRANTMVPGFALESRLAKVFDCKNKPVPIDIYIGLFQVSSERDQELLRDVLKKMVRVDVDLITCNSDEGMVLIKAEGKIPLDLADWIRENKGVSLIVLSNDKGLAIAKNEAEALKIIQILHQNYLRNAHTVISE